MSCSTEFSSVISIGPVDVFVLGSELLLLSVGAETFGFLGSLSGVSVNELYSSALFSEADGDVEVYGVVPDMYSKLCISIYNLFSCMSSSPTIETFDPNLAFLVRS